MSEARPVTQQPDPGEPCRASRIRPRSRRSWRPRSQRSAVSGQRSAARRSADADPLAGLSAERDEYLELAQRTQADFENYRKRAAKEAAAARGPGQGRPRPRAPARARQPRAGARLAGRRRSGTLLEGVRLVHAELVGVLQRSGVEPFDPSGEPFDPTVHEALSTRPQEGAAPRRRARRGGEGLPAERHDPASGPGGGLPVDGRHQGPVQDPRRRQEGLRRGDQEGLPQARAPVPPGQEPGRRGGRGALQGDPAGLRRPVRPREAQAVRPGGGIFGGGFDPGAFRTGGARGGGGFGGFGDILSDLFGGGGGAGARKPVPERGRDLETEVHISFDQAMAGRPGARRGAGALGLPDLPRHRRQAGHQPDRLPALPGSRHRVAGPGPVLDLTAVPAVRRHRHADQRSLPHLPRPRADDAGQALPGEHPGGRARRQPRPAGRQGRAGSRGGPPGRPLRDHARVPTRRSSGARATTSRWRCRSRSSRPSAAPRSRCPRCRQQAHPRARRHPARHGPAPARRGPAEARTARAAATSTTACAIDVPRSLSREQQKAVDDLAQVMDGNPRERLFAGRE